MLFDDHGKPADLLVAPYTFVDGVLARYYGFGQPGGGFTKVMRPSGWGLGLLGQGSLLAIGAHSLDTSPTKRGHLVRERLLCGVVPPPPPVVAPLPDPTGAETTRQRYEQLHLAATCAACHRLMDPIGFALEHLDASGRYRAREGRFDIDDRGLAVETSAGDLSFKGPSELGQTLARLPEVGTCLGSFLASYALRAAGARRTFPQPHRLDRRGVGRCRRLRSRPASGQALSKRCGHRSGSQTAAHLNPSRCSRRSTIAIAGATLRKKYRRKKVSPRP